MPKFKLPKTVKSLADAPESHRGAYTEKDGEFHLDLDKLEQIEFDDRAELSGALERERQERRNAKEALDKYRDIDPEKAREALAKLDEVENKKLRDKGEFDRLMEKQQGVWDSEKAALEARLSETTNKLRTHTLTNKIKDAALKAGVIPEDIDDVLTITAPRFDLDDKERIVVKDADGDPTSITPDAFSSEVFKTQKPKFYVASGAAGSGAPAGGAGGGQGGARTVKRSDFDAMAPSDRASAIKSGAVVVD